jgi:hypothetical protein
MAGALDEMSACFIGHFDTTLLGIGQHSS